MTQPNQPIDIEVALRIYMRGYRSGAATVALMSGRGEITRDQAAEIAENLAGQMENDPAALETVRDRILAYLAGDNSGPTVLKMYRPSAD
jgi:hypothetical protein